MAIQGNNLIFLISQPRSGSTMTQRILGSHSLIHTQSEPWVLLHPLHAFRDDNNVAGYNSSLYAKALNDFIDRIPGKKAKYEENIAQTYQDFYHLILKNENKQYFLDKTPRYYYIIDELLNYFPGSKVIILWRNPAAVLSSILKSWIKNDWHRLSEYKDDLLLAPKLMIEAQTKHTKQVYALKYEDLLAHPNDQISSLCKFLEINFEERMLQYGNLLREKWRYGDQETVYKRKQPDASFAEKWQEETKNPQIWRIINDYLKDLGEETVLEMGYVYDDLMGVLQKNKPGSKIETKTVAFETFLDADQHTQIEKNRLQALLSQSYDSIKQKANEISQLSEKLNNNRSIIHEKDSLIKRKDATISEQQLLINKRETELKEIKEREANLKNTINKNKKTLSEQQLLINKRETELNEIKERETNLKNTINENKKTLSEQQLLINKRETKLNEIKNREAILKNSIAQNQKTIKEQWTLIEKRDEELMSIKTQEAELRNVITQKEEIVLEQLDKIKGRENELQHLNQQLTKANEANSLHKNDLIKKNTTISQLEDELQESAKSVKRLEEIINRQNKLIREKDELFELVVKSYSFRLGSFLLKPAKKIKQLTKKE